MKSIRSRFLIAALAVLLGTTIAKSQTTEEAPPAPPMHGHAMAMGAHLHMMAFKIMTADQRAQAKAIMQKEHPTMKPLHQQLRQIDQQLRQYVEGEFDQTKVQALATQRAQIQAQLTVQETRVGNEMYQLLTADQKTQLKQMEAAAEARMQQHANEEPPAPPEE